MARKSKPAELVTVVATASLSRLSGLASVWATICIAALCVCLPFVIAGSSIIAPFVALGAVASLMVVSARRYFGSPSTVLTASVDEGGVRRTMRKLHRYDPFESGVRTEIEAGPGGRLTIITGELTTTLRLSGVANVQAAKHLHERVQAYAARQARPLREELAAVLERRGRRICDWCQAIAEHVAAMEARQSYRTAHVANDALRVVLLDRRHAVDVRAAAGHALLLLDPQDEAALAAVSSSTPPLVVALMFAAAPDAAPLAELVLQAARFIEDEDALELAHLGRPRPRIRVPLAPPADEEGASFASGDPAREHQQDAERRAEAEADTPKVAERSLPG